ncbi:MAG: general secretion pathway protein GspB [Gammaproteobacteria bacterium]|nr:general secretion pathway protein GspB [Gammaproteobacteria bacterium]
MSYILDALKKSERERGHGNIPDVQTVHSSSLNYRSEKRVYWPYILIAAVLLNLAAIIYFMSDRQLPANIEGTAQQAENTVNTSTDNITEPDKPKKIDDAAITDNNNHKDSKTTEVIVDKASVAVDKKVQQTNSEESIDTATGRQQAPSGTAIIEFHELPETIKQNLPAIIISAHVYSLNPVQRSIVINNNFMEEGEYVLDDLILYEITTDGAVFNYQGTLFNFGVVSGWQ